MQATPPPSAQVLPEAADTTPSKSWHEPGPSAAEPATVEPPSSGPKPAQLRPAEPIYVGPQSAAFAQTLAEPDDEISSPTMPDSGVTAATMIPRRPVIEEAGRSRADIPWLGIGSWLLLCGALFASLVGWPDQTALDRVTSIWSGEVASHGPAQQAPTPAQALPLPGRDQNWSAVTPRPADEPEALPPTELAPPIRSDRPGDTAAPGGGSPPLPRFKPSVDRVAAKFSNAFFEFGDRLQRQGDFDAAVHMRRQGTNLDPWKVPGASDL